MTIPRVCQHCDTTYSVEPMNRRVAETCGQFRCVACGGLMFEWNVAANHYRFRAKKYGPSIKVTMCPMCNGLKKCHKCGGKTGGPIAVIDGVKKMRSKCMICCGTGKCYECGGVGAVVNRLPDS